MSSSSHRPHGDSCKQSWSVSRPLIPDGKPLIRGEPFRGKFRNGYDNPQKFMHIYEARTSDFQKATERVYRGPQRSSAVTVLTVE